MKGELVEKRGKIMEQMISGLDETYITEAVNYQSNKQKGLFWGSLKKAAVVIFMVSVLGISGITAAAAYGYTPAMEILSKVYPDLAEQIKPVNEFCIDNDIEMKVEGIYIEDNVAKVYISMRDLTSDRIDETIDLFDSYSIHIDGAQIGNCKFVEYDTVNKMAYFLIELQNEKDNPVIGKYVTFSVSRFLSHKLTTDSNLSEIDLNEVPLNPEIRNVDDEQLHFRGGSNDRGRYNILQYNKAQAFSPVAGVQITAWGMIENELHIQVYYEDILNFDNHGYIQLKHLDAEDEYVYPKTYAYFDSDRVGSYEEYVFDLGSETDWNAYSLEARFWTCTNLTEGNWKVTFPVGDMHENKLKK